nr:ABC transporter ATP-binding protein [Pedobacter panaciterrae]
MLYFNNFRKSYGQNPILEVTNLTIKPGLYWIKGINGSGKSTLLKSIGGFLFFDGEILLNNVSVKKNGVAYRKMVNFADAEPVYPEFLTGWEMIALFAKAKQATPGQELPFIESMKMEGYLSNAIGSYSSGMLKKLSLVLAFLGRPKVILLDEPLITIDPESLIILCQWILKKHHEEDTTFLLSSHQPLNEELLIKAHVLLVDKQTLTMEQ